MTTTEHPGFDPQVHVADVQGRPIEACSVADPEMFFPVSEAKVRTLGGTWVDNDEVAAAKRECLSCYFLDACQERAIRQREPYGVWGALTTNERDALIRQRYRTAEHREEAGDAVLDFEVSA